MDPTCSRKCVCAEQQLSSAEVCGGKGQVWPWVGETLAAFPLPWQNKSHGSFGRAYLPPMTDKPADGDVTSSAEATPSIPQARATNAVRAILPVVRAT